MKIEVRRGISSFEMETWYKENYVLFHSDGKISTKAIESKKEKRVGTLAKEIILSNKTVVSYLPYGEVAKACGVIDFVG